MAPIRTLRKSKATTTTPKAKKLTKKTDCLKKIKASNESYYIFVSFYHRCILILEQGYVQQGVSNGEIELPDPKKQENEFPDSKTLKIEQDQEDKLFNWVVDHPKTNHFMGLLLSHFSGHIAKQFFFAEPCRRCYFNDTKICQLNH